jgi:hypothetical protein
MPMDRDRGRLVPKHLHLVQAPAPPKVGENRPREDRLAASQPSTWSPIVQAAFVERARCCSKFSRMLYADER